MRGSGMPEVPLVTEFIGIPTVRIHPVQAKEGRLSDPRQVKEPLGRLRGQVFQCEGNEYAELGIDRGGGHEIEF